MLRERPWPFATRQVDLALVGEQLITDWFYTYRYPSDYVTVNRVLTSTVISNTTVVTQTQRVTLPQSYPFQIGSDSAGRLIHTNVREAVCLGTVYVSDVSQYDPLFTSALAWFISAEIAIPLTKNKDLYTNGLEQYQSIVSDAFAEGMNEPKPNEAAEADMVQARQ